MWNSAHPLHRRWLVRRSSLPSRTLLALTFGGNMFRPLYQLTSGTTVSRDVPYHGGRTSARLWYSRGSVRWTHFINSRYCLFLNFFILFQDVYEERKWNSLIWVLCGWLKTWLNAYHKFPGTQNVTIKKYWTHPVFSLKPSNSCVTW